MAAPQIAFALAGKNVVDAGTDADPPKEVAEVVYSGNVAEQKDVTIELFEVDLGEGTGKPRQPLKLATFKADIVPVPSPKQGSPPGALKLTQKPSPPIDKALPRFKLEIGGETFDIGLTGLDAEGGRRFEIQIKAAAKGKRGQLKFESKAFLFARFGHFAKEPRAPVIAFITGGEDDAFFKTGTVFWQQHADVVIEQDGMSLEEIVAFLAKHSARIKKETGDKGWGEVNIVAHGNPISAKIKILKSSPEPNLRIVQLDVALKQKPSAFKVTDLGLRDTSRVVFRSCNIGRRADLLKRVKKDVFADKCEVKAPKFLQQYATAAGSASTRKATEGFVEDVTIHLPQATEPSDAQKLAAIKARFEELEKKRPTAQRQTFEKEKNTFTIKKAKLVENSVPFPGGGLKEHEAALHMKENKQRTTPEARLAAAIDADNQTDNFDFTVKEQWKRGSVTILTEQAAKELEVQASSADALPPRAIAPVGGTVVIGNNSTLKSSIEGSSNRFVNAIHSPASGLSSDQFIDIKVVDAKKVKVTTTGGATFVFNGSTETGRSATLTGKGQLKLGVGGETLTVRRSQLVTAELPIKRFSVSFRRKLRKSDPKLDFAKRPAIVPDIDDPGHYGSSNDPDPSPSELAELGK
ncbi:MAG TPA: hypothetical protein VI197_00385 [Polyangiaceae bacterium]